MTRGTIALCVVFAAPALAEAQEPAPSPSPSITVGGFVDVDAAWNASHPSDHQNFFPATGTSAKRADELSLGMAAVNLQRDDGIVGARVELVTGEAAEVVHQDEPAGPTSGENLWRNVEQAWVDWKPRAGTRLLAGIYPSHVGFESLDSRDDWNYTRSWEGELSPYYQAGVCASQTFGEWTAQLHVVNGWQTIGDVNRGKTLGTQIAWSGARASLAFNTLAGPELPNDDTHWRWFGDFLATATPIAPLSLSTEIDLGRQDLPGGAHSTWEGYAGSARVKLGHGFAAAARGELFRDERGAISGTAQSLAEATATIESRIDHDALVLKLEARHDRSTAPVFGGPHDSAPGVPIGAERQTIVVLGAVASF